MKELTDNDVDLNTDGDMDLHTDGDTDIYTNDTDLLIIIRTYTLIAI